MLLVCLTGPIPVRNFNPELRLGVLVAEVNVRGCPGRSQRQRHGSSLKTIKLGVERMRVGVKTERGVAQNGSPVNCHATVNASVPTTTLAAVSFASDEFRAASAMRWMSSLGVFIAKRLPL